MRKKPPKSNKPSSLTTRSRKINPGMGNDAGYKNYLRSAATPDGPVKPSPLISCATAFSTFSFFSSSDPSSEGKRRRRKRSRTIEESKVKKNRMKPGAAQ